MAKAPITLKQKGELKKTYFFLNRILNRDIYKKLDECGEKGVNALSSATPVDTGRTATSWYYESRITKNHIEIVWKNSNVNNGVPIAIILQYGHGTRTGGYVAGRDYINPAIAPIFDELADSVWKEVTKE